MVTMLLSQLQTQTIFRNHIFLEIYQYYRTPFQDSTLNNTRNFIQVRSLKHQCWNQYRQT